MPSLKLRLTVDIIYDNKNTHTSDLKDLLNDLPNRAMREGLLTGTTDAEVITVLTTVDEERQTYRD